MATPAPNVSLKSIRNETVTLEQLKGKVTLITFWATNCPSCLKEIPDLTALYHDYHDKGLELFAISMVYDRPSHVVAMSQSHDIPYSLVLDLRGGLAKAFGQVELIPTTLLINTQGDIVFQTTGLFDLSKMQQRIESLLPSQKG